MKQALRDKIPTLDLEISLHQKGYKYVAGVDEAGRGPLAGPVVAAAVILPPKCDIRIFKDVRDSKLLTEEQRENLYEIITKNVMAYAIAEATAREIESINIRKASLLAMKRAVDRLKTHPNYVLVDGKDYPALEIAGEAVIKGDQKSISIGAASILAKVRRDRIMVRLHEMYPQYGFDQHKGYPTAFHRAAVEIFGPCAEHRSTYNGVNTLFDVFQPGKVFLALNEGVSQCSALKSLERLIEQVHSKSAEMTEAEREYLSGRTRTLLEQLKLEDRKINPATVDVGNWYETYVTEYLETKKYKIIDRNYRSKSGEIDIVAQHGSVLVFIEVKARKNTAFGMPYESVTKNKMKKIIKTAEQYLYERRFSGGFDIRYDVISVLAQEKRHPQIDHFEDAFRTDDIS